MVVNLDTKVRRITDGSTWYSTDGGFDYAWSPDGKWFTLEFIGNRHDPYSDIGLVSAQGNKPIINLTNSGYMSGSPVLPSTAMPFSSRRSVTACALMPHGVRRTMPCSFSSIRTPTTNLPEQGRLRTAQGAGSRTEKTRSKDTAKGKKGSKKDAGQEKAADDDKAQVKDITVELKNMEDRMVRLTPNSSDMGSVIISKDGETLYYFAAFEGGYDLWKMDLRKKDTRLLHKMDAGWASMEMDKDGKNLFLLGGKTMQKMNMASDELKPVTYRAQAKMDLAAEREICQSTCTNSRRSVFLQHRYARCRSVNAR